jgi:hypothetical protein
MTIKLPLTTPTYDELNEMTPEERFGQISLALRALSQFSWDYPNAPTPYHALKFVQWDVPQVQQLISRVVSLAELEFQINGTRPPAVSNPRLNVTLGEVSQFLNSGQSLSYSGSSGRVNAAPRPEDTSAFIEATALLQRELEAREQRTLSNASRTPNPELYSWTSVRLGENSPHPAPPRPPRGHGTEGT